MKIVTTTETAGRSHGWDVAVFLSANEALDVVAILRRAREAVYALQEKDWPFFEWLQKEDAEALDRLAQNLDSARSGGIDRSLEVTK